MSGFNDNSRPIKNAYDSGAFKESSGREPFENPIGGGQEQGATGFNTAGAEARQGNNQPQHGLTGTHHQGQGHQGLTGDNQYQSQGQGYDQNQNQGSLIGDSYGSAGSDNSRYQDRTGALQQDSHRFEGREGAGPRTGGAANTDRFDSHGDSYGARDSYPDVNSSSHGRTSDPGDRNNNGKDERIVGGSMGGSNKPMGEKIKDGLTRHNDDFTNHTAAQGGAYDDTSAKFQNNTSGPGGNANAALTGREGNYRENPVARSDNDNSGVPVRSGVADEYNRSSTTDNNVHGATADANSSVHRNDGHKPGHTEDGHKPGLMEKVKEVFHK